jgi:hypothetical protein
MYCVECRYPIVNQSWRDHVRDTNLSSEMNHVDYTYYFSSIRNVEFGEEQLELFFTVRWNEMVLSPLGTSLIQNCLDVGPNGEQMSHNVQLDGMDEAMSDPEHDDFIDIHLFLVAIRERKFLFDQMYELLTVEYVRGLRVERCSSPRDLDYKFHYTQIILHWFSDWG